MNPIPLSPIQQQLRRGSTASSQNTMTPIKPHPIISPNGKMSGSMTPMSPMNGGSMTPMSPNGNINGVIDMDMSTNGN